MKLATLVQLHNFLGRLRKVSTSGLSSQIYMNDSADRVTKVQYLLCIDKKYYSLQLFGSDRTEEFIAYIITLFETGELPVTAETLADALEDADSLALALMNDISHDFEEEVRILLAAADAEITPKVTSVYLCHTVGPFAIGVYTQEFGGTSLYRKDPTDLYHYMLQAGPQPLMRLLKKCADAQIAHLDLNSANILLKNGELCLIDFGAAFLRNLLPGVVSDDTQKLWIYVQMLRGVQKHVLNRNKNGPYIFSHAINPITSRDYQGLCDAFIGPLHIEFQKLSATLATKWEKESKGEKVQELTIGHMHRNVRASIDLAEARLAAHSAEPVDLGKWTVSMRLIPSKNPLGRKASKRPKTEKALQLPA